MNYSADQRCCNCGREFADHNYVANSINKYVCPIPGQDVHYGYRASDDFMPDPEYGPNSSIGVSVFEYEMTFDPAEEEWFYEDH